MRPHETSPTVSTLDLVNLTALMEVTSGRPEVRVGLIDGPVAMDHPDLAGENIEEIHGRLPGKCAQATSSACIHGTFVAGVLCAKRGSVAPAICPNCTLLVRAIFAETVSAGALMPSATPEELARAIAASVDAGARVLNLSVGLAHVSSSGGRKLENALDLCARRGVIVVAAAGNQGVVGGSLLTRHPCVIPVAACDARGGPTRESNLGRSIGTRGVRAPGENIISTGATGRPLVFGGTSVATPFVTAAIALLWSAFPDAAAIEIRRAVTQGRGPRRRTPVPPLLDAWGAYKQLELAHGRGWIA